MAEIKSKHEDDPLYQALRGHGYVALQAMEDGRYVGVRRMNYTWGLFYGLDEGGCQGRFCYEHYHEAIVASLDFDGKSDPTGPWVKQKGRGFDGKPVDRLNPNWARDK